MKTILRRNPKKRLPKKSEMTLEEFLQFVLNGPVMTKRKYEEYKAMRKDFSKWRAA